MPFVVAAVMATVFCLPASAQTIIDDWNNVKADPAPALKPVAVDPKTTALLVMDLVKQSCNDKRPRCLATIPKVEALIAAAQAHGMTVIWTLYPGRKPEDFLADVAPPAGTPFVVTTADKFVRTDLEKMLRDKGVTTVMTVGTAAEAAVLFTASQARSWASRSSCRSTAWRRAASTASRSPPGLSPRPDHRAECHAHQDGHDHLSVRQAY